MQAGKKALLMSAMLNRVSLGEAVDFDGTNDYLSRASDFTGNADGKTFTFSVWFYSASQTTILNQFFYRGYVVFYADPNGSSVKTFKFSVFTSAPTAVINFTATGVIPENTWVHFLVSADVTNTSNRYVYMNDATVAGTWSTYADAIIDFTRPTHNVGAYATEYLDGRLAHLFLDYTYRDLSIEANRRLFVDADGFPASGQASLSPILYLPMDDPDTVAVNAGTGGDMTLNGTIARSGRGPNQYNAAASDFNGSNDYLQNLTPSFGTESQLSFSVNAKIPDGSNSPLIAISDNTFNNYIYLDMTSDNQATLFIRVGASTLFSQTISPDFKVIDAYHNYALSLDFVTGALQFYVDGVDKSSLFTFSSVGSINMSTFDLYIGRREGSGFYPIINGEVYLDNAFIDLSVDNIFWDAEASKPKPVSQVLSETGNTPLVGLPIRGDDAGNNLGTNGDFTVVSGPFTGARGPSEFWAGSAEFNGTNQYLEDSTVSMSDGKQVTLALVIKPDTLSGTDVIFNLVDSAASYAEIIRIDLSGTTLRIKFNKAGGASVYYVSNAATLTTGTTYTILISLDQATGANHICLDGVVLSPTVDTNDNTNILFGNGTNFAIATQRHAGGGTDFFDGKIGFLWFNTEYIDFSVEANRLKFFDAFNYPVDIGEDGSTPTGNQPLIYLNNEFETGVNYGSGGDFTPVNTPTDGGSVKG
jgi:hypothetical protein